MLECPCRVSVDQVIRCITGLGPEAVVQVCIVKHTSGHLDSGSDSTLADTILALCIWCAWFERDAVVAEYSLKGLIAIFPAIIVTAKTAYLQARSIFDGRFEVSEGFRDLLGRLGA